MVGHEDLKYHGQNVYENLNVNVADLLCIVLDGYYTVCFFDTTIL